MNWIDYSEEDSLSSEKSEPEKGNLKRKKTFRRIAILKYPKRPKQ